MAANAFGRVKDYVIRHDASRANVERHINATNLVLSGASKIVQRRYSEALEDFKSAEKAAKGTVFESAMHFHMARAWERAGESCEMAPLRNAYHLVLAVEALKDSDPKKADRMADVANRISKLHAYVPDIGNPMIIAASFYLRASKLETDQWCKDLYRSRSMALTHTENTAVSWLLINAFRIPR
ncbi:MAG: hypothetical protein KGI00_04010 [Candidatus Micrarchaeota archaeon]|nr:hypothetical protein [Candidatus Micrarchaeota archaeon]